MVIIEAKQTVIFTVDFIHLKIFVISKNISQKFLPMLYNKESTFNSTLLILPKSNCLSSANKDTSAVQKEILSNKV